MMCAFVILSKKKVIWNDLHFDAIFIGDDWKGNDRWLQMEKNLAPLGVDE